MSHEVPAPLAGVGDLFRQIQQVQVVFRGEALDDDSGQVEPSAAAVDDGAVAGGDDAVGFDEHGIRRKDQFNLPGQGVLGGVVDDDFFEAAGVGDGFVQQPNHRRWTESLQRVCDGFDGRKCFVDLPVGAVDARQIADASVPADEKRGMAQGRLDRDQQIVAVEHQGLVCDGRGGFTFCFSLLPLVVAAGGSHKDNSLPLCQSVAVADDFERGFVRIAPAQQPGHIPNCLPQYRQHPGREQRCIFGVWPTMFSFVRHTSIIPVVWWQTKKK